MFGLNASKIFPKLRHTWRWLVTNMTIRSWLLVPVLATVTVLQTSSYICREENFVTFWQILFMQLSAPKEVSVRGLKFKYELTVLAWSSSVTSYTEFASSSFFDSSLPDMEFLEVLTEGLNRVLLVRGGGREVITIYSWKSSPLSQTPTHPPVLHPCICVTCPPISTLRHHHVALTFLSVGPSSHTQPIAQLSFSTSPPLLHLQQTSEQYHTLSYHISPVNCFNPLIYCRRWVVGWGVTTHSFSKSLQICLFFGFLFCCVSHIQMWHISGFCS